MKILNRFWKEQLSQALKATSDKISESESVRFAIMGIGNELNGDDAAGVEVIRRLSKFIAGDENLRLIEGAQAPENFSGPLRRFSPHLLLLVDAAHLDEAPGAIRWVEWNETDGLSASTHTLPPSVLASYLIEETGCRVGLLAIQAQQLELGEPLSPAVDSAVDEIVGELTRLITKS
jgi:hydrogenase 3 maturation protease